MSQDAVYTLALALQARLNAKRAGVVVQYGGERFLEREGAPICELARDDDGIDEYRPATTTQTRHVDGAVVKPLGDKFMAIKARFSGSSSKTGAGEHDHKGVISDAADAVYCALVVISQAGRTPIGLAARGKFIAPEEGAPREIGARYELQFGMSVAVLERVGVLADSPVGVVTARVKRGPGDIEINCAPEAP